MQDSSLIGQRQIRLEKLNRLKSLGFDPFPAVANRKAQNREIVEEFEQLQGQTTTISGRLGKIREHGGIVFIDLRDQSGTLQLYIKADSLSETNPQLGHIGFADLQLLDSGDFAEATGEITKTQSGQISILVRDLRLLAKSIRPLPDVLEDKEERFRRRYVDMNVHPDVRARFERRSKFWQAHREFLNQRGFFEVNTPILEHIPGGGDAVPFTTHMNSIDENFYLRISHELPLKRLIGAGFEKVYDIGTRFRNEGLSDEHLPEHVAMEFYWAYADWKEGMKLVQELFNYVIAQVYGEKQIFHIRDFEINFTGDWEIIDFNQIMQQKYGISDVYSISLAEVTQILSDQQIDLGKDVNIPRAVDTLWKKLRKDIAGPAFLINHPKYLSPLQKASKDNPLMVERFQPIIAGSELGNGWTEVNDPVDQYERFVEQQQMRQAGDAEAQWLDIDYVEMLEYGMPPTFGWGHSERLFWFLEDVTAKEGVVFPPMKYQVAEITQRIYPEMDFTREIDQSNEQTETVDISMVPELTVASIAPDVSQAFPGLKFGYIVLENVTVAQSHPQLEKLKESTANQVQHKYNSKAELKDAPRIAGFREIYKAFGADPNSTLNSSEALLRRIVDGKGLYTVNTVVDAYNLVSIRTQLPIAAYDLNQVQGQLVIRFAEEGESIQRIGEYEPIQLDPGTLVYADQRGITCMNFNYHDANRTKITEQTNRVIVFADGHSGVSKAELMSALSQVAALLVQFSSARVVGKGYQEAEVMGQ